MFKNNEEEKMFIRVLTSDPTVADHLTWSVVNILEKKEKVNEGIKLCACLGRNRR